MVISMILIQRRRKFYALEIELRLFCINPAICKKKYTYKFLLLGKFSIFRTMGSAD